MMAASSGGYPCASKEPIIPVSTSPLPAVAIPGFPVELKCMVPSGKAMAVFRGYMCDTFQSRSIVGHGAEHAFEFVNVRCEYGMGRQIS